VGRLFQTVKPGIQVVMGEWLFGDWSVMLFIRWRRPGDVYILTCYPDVKRLVFCAVPSIHPVGKLCCRRRGNCRDGSLASQAAKRGVTEGHIIVAAM